MDVRQLSIDSLSFQHLKYVRTVLLEIFTPLKVRSGISLILSRVSSYASIEGFEWRELSMNVLLESISC